MAIIYGSARFLDPHRLLVEGVEKTTDVEADVIVMVGQFGHWKTPFAKDFKMPSLNDLVPMSMDLVDGTGSSVDAVRVQIERVGGAA